VRGPKHTEDEEVSLFPRLRGHGGVEAGEAFSAVAELEAQHRAAELAHAEFDALAGRLPRDGSAEAGDVDRFTELATALSDLYRPHIRVEDELVFPAAARGIPPSVLAAIGEEMRARRRDLLRSMSTVVAVTARR
jgi:hemerythrin-like domain-containing protein